MSTSTWPSRGTSVLTAASTENVPLPCIGTQTCVSWPWMMSTSLRRTSAVTALNAASHEPQSRSIALLVGERRGQRAGGEEDRIAGEEGSWDFLELD